MTTLGTHPVDEPDLLALIADEWTVHGQELATAFRAACWNVGRENPAWLVDPNLVRAQLIAWYGEDGYNPRQLSALWSTATAKDGYLDNTDTWVQITGGGSRGNGNKSVRLRRWRAA